MIYFENIFLITLELQSLLFYTFFFPNRVMGQVAKKKKKVPLLLSML